MNINKRQPASVVCIYSGGMDSYTLAGFAHAHGHLHSCLSFDYGQRHRKELRYAKEMAKHWGVPYRVIPLPRLPGSALTDEGIAVPEGHYADDNMKATVVPYRNMIMLSHALAYAAVHRVDAVWYGAHAGDHTIYPDCRPEFTEAINRAALLGDWHPVHVEAPFQRLTKAGILRVGLPLGLDYSRTWTCYKGARLACGKCGSCRERLEAFAQVGVVDPVQYEAQP